MDFHSFDMTATYFLHALLQFAFIVRVLMRRHRQPAARIAWIAVILAVPVVGMAAYVLLGEINVGRRRVARERAVQARLPAAAAAGVIAADASPDIPPKYAHLFHASRTVNGFSPTGGNCAKLMADSNAAIDAIVADIDAATDHVHVQFYIWLSDNNGLKVVEALKRAASRGVVCRAMADGLGSRAIIKSRHWRAMREAGVRVTAAMPIGKILLRPFRRRIDLRNHRKMVVIDDHVAYCGSQNCADPEFRVKAKYAPWVDVMMRFEGPVVRQSQYLFVTDWMTETGEDIVDLLLRPLPPDRPGFTASVVGTGPTVRNSAMPEMFESLMYTARRELTITTPYYVPDEAMQAGLCASARRGVVTTVIFPARNDSWFVAAASRSYYADLLEAGVRIYEYQKGLLHTKSLTLDGEVSLIGSANMDRRSFDLDYENNILFCDPSLTAEIYRRQQEYIADSKPVDPEVVENWPRWRRLWNNTAAMLGPVL